MVKQKFDNRKLKKLRVNQGLSFLELARALKPWNPKVSKSSVWGWENGNHTPTIKSLTGLSSFFSVPVEEFLK